MTRTSYSVTFPSTPTLAFITKLIIKLDFPHPGGEAISTIMPGCNPTLTIGFEFDSESDWMIASARASAARGGKSLSIAVLPDDQVGFGADLECTREETG
jgi:hypothetical protein